MRRRRTTPHEKGYTQSGEIPEKTCTNILCDNVLHETVLRCLDEPLHVASPAQAECESTKKILKNNRHRLGDCHAEEKEEANSKERKEVVVRW